MRRRRRSLFALRLEIELRFILFPLSINLIGVHLW
jgi:hypothetical protein